ncbi:sensor histidine kinase [Tsuneonella sp. HG249]
MFDWLSSFLAMRGLPPHGYCLLWDPRLVWTHVVADTVIAVAYFSIPFLLWRLLKARPDVDFGWIMGLFAVFILACGTTHLFGIYTLWVPAYGVEAAIKVVTAIASIGTAIVLVPLLPKLVALPSPAQLRAVNEQLLAESVEREKTAEMLRQSQKLEALGRLTGGVAHDFNNLLQVVIGNIERVQRRAGEGEPALQRSIRDALTAAERAAALTDQLLTFAARQSLAPKPLALADLIGEVAPLIERATGPAIDVDYAIPAGTMVMADWVQLENSLINLAINARDAMLGGGRLEILARVPEESFELVELRVTDTGEGMDAETLARATDPFFTTKPLGEGTGLGLSQVFGMVEQLGGSLRIESEPGTGTTVRMFLPRVAPTEGS